MSKVIETTVYQLAELSDAARENFRFGDASRTSWLFTTLALAMGMGYVRPWGSWVIS